LRNIPKLLLPECLISGKDCPPSNFCSTPSCKLGRFGEAVQPDDVGDAGSILRFDIATIEGGCDPQRSDRSLTQA
jgi:hypothetical protein